MLSELYSELEHSVKRIDSVPKKKWTVGEKALFANLPCWSGDGIPVRQWVKAWQQTKELIDWNSGTEQIRCFKAKLQGKAWEWTVDQPSFETCAWTIENWEAALIEAFAIAYHPSTAVIEFHIRKKEMNESVDAYAFSLLRLAYHTGQYDREDLAESFVAGLGDEIAKEIANNGEHVAFEEAWSRARALEAKMKCFEKYGLKIDRKCYSCGTYGHCSSDCHKSPRGRKSSLM